MRVVLDTNSLIVSIGRQSIYRPIFDAIIEGRIILLISNDIVSEYVEKLAERTTAIVASNVAEFLINSKNVDKVEIYFKWQLIQKDQDDNKFVDCALNGRASFLVTDDKHFKVLKKIKFPSVEIIRTKDFLEMMQNKQVP